MRHFNVIQTGKPFGIGVLRTGRVWTSILRFKTEDFIVPTFNVVFSSNKGVYDAQFAVRYKKGVSYTIITVAHCESFSGDLVALCKAISTVNVIHKVDCLESFSTMLETANGVRKSISGQTEPTIGMDSDGSIKMRNHGI